MAREDSLLIAGDQVLTRRSLQQVYAANGHVPLWTEPATVARMLEAMVDIANDGLDPADYHFAALNRLGSATPEDPLLLARRDILLTDALQLMAYHLAFGKTDPERLDEHWNLHDLYEDRDLLSARGREKATADLLSSLADGAPERLLVRARPQLPFYRRMRDAHARYRALVEAGGWPAVAEGPTLGEGATGERISWLRRRLTLTGDLAADALNGEDYDAVVAAAVVRFQARHGLDADGIVGPLTLAALNVPAEARARQLRINLERDRWVMRFETSDLMLVNIAAFEAWLVRDHALVWRSRVQVGQPFTQTPVFSASMTYLEFNPTWTVPASIADRTILPRLQGDPAYLAQQNMKLLDRQGREVEAASVDWNSVDSMPYTVRQDPGPGNALGRVKFMFPNEHAVYLHDTPSRQNFSRSARAFSAGCIRVEKPLELAALLLADQTDWTPARIDQEVADGKRTTVRLGKALPVVLLYWTAYVDADGSVQFRQDLYDRDAAVLAALSEPPLLHRRHLARPAVD
jgi:murein L,D-transpeptidase YcbB/YkuD